MAKCFRVVLTSLGLSLSISPISSQTMPLSEFTRPETVSERGYTKLVGMKELKDGRVILVDEIERAVLLLDSGLVEVSPVGRSGSGPGEYIVPSRLFPLVGDSSVVRDTPNRRLLVLTPEGEPGGVINYVPHFPRIDASDGQGRFFRQTRVGDSYAIVRWSPPSTALDTVARFPLPDDAVPTGSVRRVVDMNPFPLRTTWSVAADGTLAIVHPDPYQVELIDPEGVIRKGPAIEVDRLRVTEGHKDQWREEEARPRTVLYALRGEEGHYVTMTGEVSEPNNWPRYLPPFLGDAAMFAGDGRLWVRRTTPAGDPPTFDVFDSEGRRVERVKLPHGRRLLGFGQGKLYAVSRDEFALEYLERYEIAQRSPPPGPAGSWMDLFPMRFLGNTREWGAVETEFHPLAIHPAGGTSTESGL